MNWFHRFFNPHCEHCLEEKLEASNCKSCETLRSMLEQSNAEKSKLLETILKQHEPVAETRGNEEIKPILPRVMPWRVKQALLESEDRQKAILERKKEEELKTEKLEKEIGITGEAS